MPIWTTTTDTTTNNLPNSGARGVAQYRPSPTAATYLPGSVLQLVAVDKQLYSDFSTVQLMPASTTGTKFAGVVGGDWQGFSSSTSNTTSYTSATNTNYLLRGTQFVNAVVKGHAEVLVDQSGSGAVTITDGIPLVSSRNTAGYAQGVAVATAVGLAAIGVANLPSTGIGSSLTAASLAQAAQTFTVATPASGDTVNTTIQSPYTTGAPGTANTTTWSLTLNSTTAASATTAGNAIVAFLNAQPGFSQYFTATNTAGAVLVTVNANSAPFLVTFGSGSNLTGQVTFGVSGMLANSLTTAGSVTGSGGTTYSAGASTFASGTGYFGLVSAFIYGEF